MSKLELVPITPENYESALALSVRPDQEDLVAPVQKSLADADAYPDALFRLAMWRGMPVGYLLIYPFDSERGRTVNMVRLMIDRRFQAQGLGRELLEVALEWTRTLQPTVDIVRVSTLPRNHTALALYESTGFVRSGCENGEIALYLRLGGADCNRLQANGHE